ncbi:CoA transferase having broad substrate specificity for short-chain acyl-CoA thioesters with the activity decreasing when the length of the carboxylic acid chain exceeds four carbons [Vibrio sp. B1REV9]|uniref:acyl CoA:acetate/3-ketoacid CoA transferase n=1 Tax=Vibrio sp. B1REV9 TaxID=2751179 RepID=UPI001AF508DE|nr:CoA-transferase [Vibrio sp. B1REV9]CAE6939643.1 CoA transferase having broad substrate specificity for short-chain acyl-CoA thioesters with the activity decreasing when the length of the carboxylic acid chain exceeds four carbons [Vibrio sp. B1REV9]
MKKKVLTALQAAQLINDGDRVVLGGFIGAVVPEAIEKAVGERYLETGHPNKLELFFTAGQGNGVDKATNHLSHPGMVSKACGGHWGLIPKLQQLANSDQIQGYNFPQGVIAQLLRDSAAGKPGTLSHVGLGTFVDPRLGGGKINQVTTEDRVSVMSIDGEEYLFYKRINPNVALLRGTTADEHGNVTMEDECLFLENLAAAQLVTNMGGTVIVQVKHMVKCGELDPQQVRIPGIFVDAIVIANEEDHMQTFAEAMNPAYCGRGVVADKSVLVRPLDAKKIIARRAALELKQGAILNYGIGVPEVIAQVTDEEGITDQMIATVEPGAIGGTPAGGLSFGASAFPEAVITQDQMFDFYDGGGIDQAFLGLAECDQHGNLNVSKFGSKIAGCGGFINITQNAKQVFFCGTFTAGKLEIETGDGTLSIVNDGHIQKLIGEVQQITFSADVARRNGKPVLYITERAVFKLGADTLELIEIAPGVDLEKDILSKMSFKPIISHELKLMDSRIFHEKPMGLTFPEKVETKQGESEAA